jgi:hypothetical protein
VRTTRAPASGRSALADAAEIPKIAELLLAKLNATLTIQPVLTMEHLQRGIGAAPG